VQPEEFVSHILSIDEPKKASIHDCGTQSGTQVEAAVARMNLEAGLHELSLIDHKLLINNFILS